MCFVLADIDECSSSPCENGVCNNQVNSYQCNCNAGWEGTNCDGTNNALKKLLPVKQFLYLLLVETDECASNPCNTNAVCTDGVNSFSCACPEGWADANCQGFKNPEKYFLFLYYMAKFLTTNVSVSIWSAKFYGVCCLPKRINCVCVKRRNISGWHIPDWTQPKLWYFHSQVHCTNSGLLWVHTHHGRWR